MKYQLVLQWPASAIKDYDAMIEVEDVLRERLSKKHDVDGHDAGSGEVNIFVLTDDPVGAFRDIKSILGSQDHLVNARVAYRQEEEDTYTILWPENLTDFKLS